MGGLSLGVKSSVIPDIMERRTGVPPLGKGRTRARRGLVIPLLLKVGAEPEVIK